MPKVFEFTGTDPLPTHRILVTGSLPRCAARSKHDHLQLCDVFLQPSLWDGMPNALLEAMAAGCGSISSDAGGIPEIVTPGVDGVILPRWQLHRLSEAILEWADAGEPHQRRIREAARKRIVEHFNPQQEQERLLAIVTALVDR